jgi:hypothetical protein
VDDFNDTEGNNRHCRYPAVIGVFLLVAFVEDIRRDKNSLNAAAPIRLSDMKLSADFKVFLLVSAIFTVGNSSDAFLILRAKDPGLSLGLTIVVYTVFNAAYTLTSFPAGALSNRIGRTRESI